MTPVAGVPKPPSTRSTSACLSMAWAMAWRTRLSLRAGWPSPIGSPLSRAAPTLKASSSKPE